jgi:hypothetical protein
MTRNTRHEWHIGVLHRLEIAVARDAHMTRHAIAHGVLFLLVIELQ